MKRVLLLALTLLASSARADEASLSDIEKTLGQVPTFMRNFPSEALDSAWGDMKALELNPNTALPGKVKELIGLAVAAQIPCRYCIYFHTQAAKLNGATSDELGEALLAASTTRRWSTVLNGNQIDEAQFRAEFAKIVENARAGKIKPNTGVKVVDATSAMTDIEGTLGFVPGFFKSYPEVALAPAWKGFKGLWLSQTQVAPKYKELIGLAVASQIPCRFCIVAHTELARLNGATATEIEEAVGMAAATRFWSTYLNGSMTDEATFKKETDQIVSRFRKATAKK